MKIQSVTFEGAVRDRCALKGVIRIGDKLINRISFAAALSTPKETDLFIQRIAGENLAFTKVCVFKMHDAGDTIKLVLAKSKLGNIDSPESYTVKNVYANHFLQSIAVIIDPAPDSMKYEGHMRKFSVSPDVHPELRKFASWMEVYRSKKKRGSRDEDGIPLESRIKKEYGEFWESMMQNKNMRKLRAIIEETIESEFRLGADIGMAPVPVIDSLRMLEITKLVNQIALLHWPEDQRDTAATYIILAPEVFSDPDLMKRIIEYIQAAETKFIVIKFKNLELDQRNKADETLRMKDLLKAISEVKQKHKEEKVFVALEAGVQNYLFAVGGFDIVSTSMTGMDGDYAFKRGDKTAINGYYDIANLIFRNDRWVRMILAQGIGFPHEGCVCSRAKDYASAKLDWPDIRREHYVRRMDELCADVWVQIGKQTIEECKARISRSRLANLKQALPFLEYVA